MIGIVFLALCAAVAHAQSGYTEIDVRGGGTVNGVVRLRGNAGNTTLLDVSKDQRHCGTKRPSPRLVVGKSGGVRNAIVRLDGISHGKRFPPATPAVIDQRKCEYTPHVSVVRVGGELEIVNSDPILHNVHGYNVTENMRSVCNIAQPIKGQRTTIKRSLTAASGLYTLTCDAGHPWMSAFLFVTDHPYVAVTDAHGRFVIDNIPPGSYTVTMWHEGVRITRSDMERGVVKRYEYEDAYESSRSVTVSPNGTTTVDFDLVPR